MLSIGIPLQSQQLRFDLGDKLSTLFTLRHIQQLLNDIVAKSVLHHRQQRRRVVRIDLHNLINDMLTITVAAKGYTLLNNIGRKLVLRKFKDLAKNTRNNLLSILWFSTFNNMLNDIVSTISPTLAAEAHPY